jgi:glycosyltransferase involved in cell wall biosynthesis
MPPLVSVYIPTHNRASALAKSIDSVLLQSYPNIEIIVSNDGSSDSTKQLLENLQQQHKNIQVIHSKQAKGACHARNLAINQANGEFITGLDDDDLMLPDRIKTLVDAYHDDYAFVCSADYNVHGNGRKEKTPRPKQISLQMMLYKNVAGNQVLTTTKKLRAINGFDESLKAAQDYDTWLRLIERFGKAKGINTALQLINYDDNATRISTGSNRFSGNLAFHLKHKDKMNLKQRTYRLYILYKMRQKPMTLSTLKKLLACNYRDLVKISYYLKLKFSLFNALYKKAKAIKNAIN